MTVPDPAPTSASTSSAVRDALIRRAYEGEITGCALYRTMITGEMLGSHDVLPLLYEVERITAEALEPVVARFDVSVDPDAAAAEGVRLAAEFSDVSWNAMWESIVELADDYLLDFYRLETALEGHEFAAVARQVVEHEEAQIEFARRELRNHPDPTEPLRSYLCRYSH